MRRITKRRIVDFVITMPFYFGIGLLAYDINQWWRVFVAQFLLMVFGLWHFYDGQTRLDLYEDD